MDTIAGTSWFYCEESREDAPLRLFCFPGHAGSVLDFEGWASQLGSDAVECYYVQLPGRGLRREEACVAGAKKLLDSLVNEILTHMDKPFIFFGHTIGAQVAFALALELEGRGLPQPRRLMVSNCPPFQPHKPISTLPKAWRDKLDTDGSLPADLAGDLALLIDLFALVSPKQGTGTDLTCPVTVFGRAEAGHALREWGGYTQGELAFRPIADTNTGAGTAGQKELLEQIDGILHSDVKLSRRESIKLIDKWNSGRFEYPDKSCLHDLFRRSAAANPDATAIVYQGESLTFREVDELTDRLANWLYAAGVRVGSSVGIFMEHCDEYALAFIAAHKAGGAYMPLEIVYPTELLLRVLQEAKPACVLTKAAFEGRLPEWQTKLSLDKGSSWKATVAAAPPLPADRELPTPDSLAYVVMSSGTTGIPKGICCPHRGAVHSYYYRLLQYPYAEGEREACHVFFVWELLRPLLGGLPEAGGLPVPLYVIPDDHIYNPSKLVKYLGDNLITRVLFTPSLLQLVLDTCGVEELKRSLATLKIVWLCGEVVTVELRNKFVEVLPKCQLENLYSISECHDISYANLNTLNTRESPKYAPCGTVIPNVTAYIVDEQMRQVPIGVPGRMYIGGPCLALGYLNMPDKTAQRFVPNPFSAGQLMYDTGDRCRYLPSGSIEVIGRCDFMVKIRGYSVVVGAVEATISEHPLVSTACVLTEGAEGSMDKKLVAYVVPERWERVPTVVSIQRFLKAKLPPYAIPSVFILLDAIPINMASGKLDRRKLPRSNSDVAKKMPVAGNELLEGVREEGSLEADAGAGRGGEDDVEGQDEREPPKTPTERLLAQLWAELLKVDPGTVRRSHDFFDLGGHSLLLIKMAHAIATHPQTQLELCIPEILERPVLSDLAAYVDKELRKAGRQAAQNGNSNGNGNGNGNGAQGPVQGRTSASPPPPDSDMVDLSAEAARLDPSIYPAPTRKTGYSRYRLAGTAQPPSRVLLTGATGFLGAHLLSCLLLDTEVAVYCLVRAKDEDEAAQRLENNLRTYKLWEPLESRIGLPVLADRMIPVLGDLSRPLLGLGLEDFKVLAGELDAIIHNGAKVNLVRSYHSLKAVNVLGTQEVLRLAVTNGISTRVKPVHYVSTNGVFPFSMKTFSETADMTGLWQELNDGYGQSKWVAEQMCFEARRRGLPVSILRPGNMAPSASHGVWNTSDFIYLILQGCLELRSYPNDVPWKLDMTPVEFAARAIVHTTVQAPQKSLGQVLHIQNPAEAVPFLRLVEWLKASTGLPLEGVPLAEFRVRVSSAFEAIQAKSKPGEQAESTLPHLVAGLDSFDYYLSDPGHMQCSGLMAALQGTEVTCPEVDPSVVATWSASLTHLPST